MNDLKDYKAAMPDSLQRTLDNMWNKTDSGNLSMKVVSYKQVQRIGKYINNNVPMKDRDAFVKQFVSNSVADFWGKFRKSKLSEYRWR
jgi:hypothetical protein